MDCCKNKGFKTSPVTSVVASGLYKYANKFYNFKGLGFHKDRYEPQHQDQAYLASRKKFTLLDIVKLLKLNRII